MRRPPVARLLPWSALLLAACTQNNAPGPYTKPGPLDTGDSAAPGADPYDVVVGPYDASVRWTSYGVPHIEAADEGSLGYGMGYAFARDHVCTLMDQVVMVNSQRARFFGRGVDDIHVHTDFGWLALGVKAQAEAGWAGLDPRMQARPVGYAAGVNRHVEQQGGALPDAPLDRAVAYTPFPAPPTPTYPLPAYYPNLLQQQQQQQQ